MSLSERYPALGAWQAEVAAGERTLLTQDALWRAACAERNAAEFENFVPELAEAYCEDARRILEAELRRRGVA